MLNYLKGNVTQINSDFITFEVNEIGYKVYTLSKDKYELLENYKIFIYDHINSDNVLDLYGFLSLDDLNFFRLLIKINGIGPKTAHNILKDYGALEIINFIREKDIVSLRKIPGIGSKANMLILNLRGKLDNFKFDILRYENVYKALIHMNFNPLEIRDALDNIKQNLSDEDALRAALIEIKNARK